jgi:hypothetical protein
MYGSSRDLVEHRLPIKANFRPYTQHARCYNPLMYGWIKEKIDQLLKANLLDLVGMPSGFLIECRWRKRDPVKLEYALILEISIELLLKMNIICLLMICLLMMLQDIKLLVFLIVMLVTINFLWPRKICTKQHLDVLVLLAYLSGLS